MQACTWNARWLVVSVCLSAVGMAAAQAQNPPNAAVASSTSGVVVSESVTAGALEALSASCQASDYLPQDTKAMVWPKAQPAQPVQPNRIAGCSVEAMDIKQALEQSSGNMTLVDVRPFAAKRDYVPHALEVSLRDLPQRSFLKGQNVVLLGTGLDDPTLLAVCEDLQRQGFSQVQSVRGGAPAFLEAAGLVSTAYVRSITPAQWVQSLMQGQQWHLAISATQAKEHANELPMPAALQWSAKQSQSLGSLATVLRQQQAKLTSANTTTALSSPLIVLADGLTSQALEQQLQSAAVKAGSKASISGIQATHSTPIYVLEGGWPAYEAFVQQNHEIQVTAAQSLQRACGAL
ncbi:hypothetical protein E9531_15475 [Lampropedia puyangensis]|uniref:Rhodanese domain-containing protein n=1 Tax=Lampropedia puyangensis TaxID=1330072 RepID=A0A4S8ET94_9BURK|nr:hypothetical protein [Lampropedia puyangensis]THT97696.1 hypothetical protein E9531_15475 [Lampropedia puyangensis]